MTQHHQTAVGCRQQACAVAGNVDAAFDLSCMGLACVARSSSSGSSAAVQGIAEGRCQAVVRRTGFGEVANLDIVGPGVGANAGCCDAHAPIIVKPVG